MQWIRKLAREGPGDCQIPAYSFSKSMAGEEVVRGMEQAGGTAFTGYVQYTGIFVYPAEKVH